MATKTVFVPVAIFLVAFVGYLAIARLTFRVPHVVGEGQECLFTAADFNQAGQLKFSDNEAWLTSFIRKEEYFSAFSVSLAIAFAGFAVIKVRQIGLAAASGSVAGGGLLVGLALSLSCLAPVLATLGVGLFANFGLSLVAIPKGFIALNNLVLTSWGFLYLSRRATSCPLALHGSSVTTACGEAACCEEVTPVYSEVAQS